MPRCFPKRRRWRCTTRRGRAWSSAWTRRSSAGPSSPWAGAVSRWTMRWITVGFVITVKPGDKIPGGEPIASVFAKDPAGIKLGFEALQQAIVIGDKLTEKPLPLISHRVTKAGVEQLKR